MNFDKSNYKEKIVDEYNRKVTNYGNGKIEITTYNQPQIRLLGNLNHKGGANSQSVISKEAQEQRTLKQSYAIKRRIRGYALANDFEWFVTLTIDPKKNNSFDYNHSKTMLLKWCRFMRDTYDKFDYLIIPEFHKSGAIHFHGLLGNISANFVEATHPNNGLPLLRNERQIYNLDDWKYGFTDCEKIVDSEKTASYLTKYITKELMTHKDMFRKKRYFNSKGLKKPQIEYITSETDDLKGFTPNFGIVETDSQGNNVLDKAIYKLEQDSNGQLVQTTSQYLIKAKNNNNHQKKSMTKETAITPPTADNGRLHKNR